MISTTVPRKNTKIKQPLLPRHSSPLGKTNSSKLPQPSKKNTASSFKKDERVAESEDATINPPQNTDGVRAIISHLKSTGLVSDPSKSSTILDNTKEASMDENNQLEPSGSLSLLSDSILTNTGRSQKGITPDHQNQVDVRVDGVSFTDKNGNSPLTVDPGEFNSHSSKGFQAIPVTLMEGILDPSKHSVVVFHVEGVTEGMVDNSFTMANFRSKYGGGFKVRGRAHADSKKDKTFNKSLKVIQGFISRISLVGSYT